MCVIIEFETLQFTNTIYKIHGLLMKIFRIKVIVLCSILQLSKITKKYTNSIFREINNSYDFDALDFSERKIRTIKVRTFMMRMEFRDIRFSCSKVFSGL